MKVELHEDSARLGFSFALDLIEYANAGEFVEDTHLKIFEHQDLACSLMLEFSYSYLLKNKKTANTFFDFLNTQLVQSAPGIAQGIYTSSVAALLCHNFDGKTFELASTGRARGLKTDHARIMARLGPALNEMLANPKDVSWKGKLKIAAVMQLDLNTPFSIDNEVTTLAKEVAELDESDLEQPAYKSLVGLLMSYGVKVSSTDENGTVSPALASVVPDRVDNLLLDIARQMKSERKA
ncbi:MAG TPA: hypothetical protein VM577_13785 [Anaerovoracaceae bacterium]|nr:hypothetical protein [Anaerovoracaceae bacterium]